MVGLTVTETRFNKPHSVNVIERETKHEAIAAMLAYFPDARFVPSALISMLSQHDDLRLGGPTWDVRFQFSFSHIPSEAADPRRVVTSE
jgi:hypothetical protein